MMDPLLRLHAQTVIFSVRGLPLLGNLATGGVVGLTEEGTFLCQRMARDGVAPEEVPDSCATLVRHLADHGYLATESGEVPVSPHVRSAYLHVTQRCDLSCMFCYSEDASRNRLPDPSLQDLLHALDLLASLGTARLVISGGEPFLRDDLAGIAAHARERGFTDISLLTNGLHVTPARLQALAGLVDTIAVAFDGCSADDPAYLRGAQRFDRLVQAVGHVRDAGFTARILPTLHGRNVGDIPRYQQLAQRLGATLSFSLLTAPMGDLGELALSPCQLHDLALLSAREQLGAPGGSLGDAHALSARLSCGAGARTLSVAANGTVFPCHMLHLPELALGNAFTDEPDAFAQSEVRHRFQNLSVRSFERCHACGVRYLCGGGCRARAYLSFGDLYACDPFCELSRVYFNELITMLKRRYVAGEE